MGWGCGRKLQLSAIGKWDNASEEPMRLVLNELSLTHPALRGHPVDLAKYGGLALQREGHSSPVQAEVDSSGIQSVVDVEWLHQDLTVLEVLDKHRVTEDGAEAVALAYANSEGGWVVKRRLQRRERADWLLRNQSDWLVLEISGTTTGDPYARLEEKLIQVAGCSLPANRLAVVVAFSGPQVVAGSP